MGLIFRLEESDFSGYIDEGEQYLAQVVNVKLREMPFKDKVTGETVRKVEFQFRLIADDDHDGDNMWGETGTKFNTHPNCRLKAWSEAILGQALPANFELDTDMLVDRRCRVVIGKKQWDKDGETQTRNFVANVNPTREAAATLAASQDAEPF